MSSSSRTSGDKPASGAPAASPHTSGEFEVPKPQTPSKLLKSPVRRSPSRSPHVGPSPMRVAKRNRDDGIVTDLRLDAATALSLTALPDSADRALPKRPFRPSFAPIEYSEEQNKILETMWSTATVSSFLTTQKAVVIDSHASLVSAFNTLARHGIMSAPVWDAPNKRIVGLLDYRDLCALVIKVLTSVVTPCSPLPLSAASSGAGASGTVLAVTASGVSPHSSAAASPLLRPATTVSSSSSTSSNNSSNSAITAARRLSRASTPTVDHKEPAAATGASPAPSASGSSGSSGAFTFPAPLPASSTASGGGSGASGKFTLASVLSYAPAGLVADFSHRDNFYSVPLTSTFLQAMPYFSMGLHRVCVLTADTAREFVGVVSQSDALRHLQKHLDQVSFLADKTLAELGLIPSAPLTAPQDASVLEALILMQDNAVSSLALVDGKGALVANLSMTDIKHVFASGQLSLLQHPCKDLIREVRRRRDEESHYETKVPVFHCSPHTTLRKVVGSMVATRTHRIWVTATPSLEPSAPIAVVTLTDILRLLTPATAVKLPAAVPKSVKPISFVPAV